MLCGYWWRYWQRRVYVFKARAVCCDRRLEAVARRRIASGIWHRAERLGAFLFLPSLLDSALRPLPVPFSFLFSEKREKRKKKKRKEKVK